MEDEANNRNGQPTRTDGFPFCRLLLDSVRDVCLCCIRERTEKKETRKTVELKIQNKRIPKKKNSKCCDSL